YEAGKKLLGELGYIEIGMDHFSLKTDSLYKAMKNKTLHRNFMGYSASKTQLMVGLGMSSISDSWHSFAQNVKTIEEYTELVNKGLIPIFKGHLLTPEDLIIRKHILNIMCNFETSWESDDTKFPELEECLSRLDEMVEDGLVEISETGLRLPEEARPFVRNVCMAFDLKLIHNQPKTRIFSMTI
ncbi:MAG: coproporphyrinogen III oxidase, partial [Gillisia sp.]|nr:coproporphyrinogen III oxidase [Gillisia sp.]